MTRRATLPDPLPDFGSAIDYSLADSFLSRRSGIRIQDMFDDHAPADDGDDDGRVPAWLARLDHGPEMWLWVLVLRRAMLDAQGKLSTVNSWERAHCPREAREWIRSASNDVGSIRWVFSIIGLAPDAGQRLVIRKITGKRRLCL